MSGQDEYTDWDAAYLIGALSVAERHEYERHLSGCESCTRLVAELSALPGLLGTVPAEQAIELDRQLEEPHPETGSPSAGLLAGPRQAEQSLPRLIDRVRRRRRRARVLVAGALLTVAVAAAVAVVLPGVLPGATPTAAPVAAAAPDSSPPVAARTVMQQVVPSPLSASFVLTGEPWGTRIDSSCSYAKTGGGGDSGKRAYSMYVTDTRGAATLVATWLAGPGTAIEAVGTSSVARRDIASVDIRLEPDGLVLLAGRPAS